MRDELIQRPCQNYRVWLEDDNRVSSCEASIDAAIAVAQRFAARCNDSEVVVRVEVWDGAAWVDSGWMPEARSSSC